MARVKRDIVEVIGGYVDLRAAGTTQAPRWDGLCPFHDDHNPSLSVYENSQRYVCWSCGAKGDVIDFLMRKLNIPFSVAKDLATTEADTLDTVLRRLQMPNRPSAPDPTRDIGNIRTAYPDADFDVFAEAVASYWHYFHSGHLELARNAIEPLQYPRTND